jgi:hypothetical protein
LKVIKNTEPQTWTILIINNHNKISNEMKQHCDNKGKLKVDEQTKLQKKCIEEVKQMKQQNSPCSSRNYEHNGETPNLWKKRVTHEKQKEKGISMVRI